MCYWQVSQKERDHREEQDVGSCIIIGMILERLDRVEWTTLVWPRIGTSGVNPRNRPWRPINL
jgi:hypothetical protein